MWSHTIFSISTCTRLLTVPIQCWLIRYLLQVLCLFLIISSFCGFLQQYDIVNPFRFVKQMNVSLGKNITNSQIKLEFIAILWRGMQMTNISSQNPIPLPDLVVWSKIYNALRVVVVLSKNQNPDCRKKKKKLVLTSYPDIQVISERLYHLSQSLWLLNFLPFH